MTGREWAMFLLGHASLKSTMVVSADVLLASHQALK